MSPTGKKNLNVEVEARFDDKPRRARTHTRRKFHNLTVGKFGIAGAGNGYFFGMHIWPGRPVFHIADKYFVFNRAVHALPSVPGVHPGCLCCPPSAGNGGGKCGLFVFFYVYKQIHTGDPGGRPGRLYFTVKTIGMLFFLNKYGPKCSELPIWSCKC